MFWDALPRPRPSKRAAHGPEKRVAGTMSAPRGCGLVCVFYSWEVRGGLDSFFCFGSKYCELDLALFLGRGVGHY